MWNPMECKPKRHASLAVICVPGKVSSCKYRSRVSSTDEIWPDLTNAFERDSLLFSLSWEIRFVEMSQRDCLQYRECDIDTKWDHCDPIECLRDMNPTNLEALVFAISIVRSYCEIHVTSLLHKTTFSPTSWRSIENSLRATFLMHAGMLNPGGIYFWMHISTVGARPSVIDNLKRMLVRISTKR